MARHLEAASCDIGGVGGSVGSGVGFAGGRRAPSPLSARRRAPLDVDQLVIDMELRLTQLSQNESSRLRMITDQVEKLLENLQSLRVQRELQDERRQQEVRFLERHTEQDLAKAREDQRNFHLKLAERSDKFFQSRAEELRQRRSPEAREGRSCKDLADRMSREVDRLNGALEEQRVAREEYGDRIQSSLQGEFQNVEDAIHSERSLRHEAQHTMQRMVQDVCTRIQSEIGQERETREIVQNRLLGLLEETCGRIEGSFGGSMTAHSLSLSLSGFRGGQHALY